MRVRREKAQILSGLMRTPCVILCVSCAWSLFVFPLASHHPFLTLSSPSYHLPSVLMADRLFPSNLYPLVRAFLATNGFAATVVSFDKELGSNVCAIPLVSLFCILILLARKWQKKLMEICLKSTKNM